MNRIIAFVVVIVVALLVASSTVFVVDPRHVAVVTGSGDSAPTLDGPGLHLKLPAPLQTATLIDTRVQAFDTLDTDRYTTADKTELLVEPVIRYRVTEPLELFAATRGDLQTLSDRLAVLSRDALSDAFSKYTLSDALAQQQNLAGVARASLKASAAPLGIEVLDVEFTRVDYPAELADAVYKRMSAAREQAAADERERGTAEAQQIRDDAARRQQAVLASAYDEAQQIKGDGDAKAAAIAAQAFNRDPQFYQFYQSMRAYRESFKPNDVIVVDSSNDFFRFMRSPTGEAPPAAAPASRRH
ncbi:protease modulator HflC [Burkholderia sp. WAC0059]|uniref:protease modulator HflC n=1 Tax=Burkholderia sp. WAC0059 TaxID=2066022 RepID=UPI000C7F6324|nr:protease modulator HflC [Burkholderia sp. WAC0059]PLZ02727.1 protease modulator HflC [Burkholderia sp. WAC0059]